MLLKKYLSLSVWIVSILTISFFLGHLTRNQMVTWYNTLNQSLLTPPAYWFSIVWTILYTIIAINGWIIWQKKWKNSITIKIAYALQLLLNWSWVPLFFHYQCRGVSFVCILTLITVVGFLIVKAYKDSKIISLLFLPYLGWLLFAAYLNFYIWKHN